MSNGSPSQSTCKTTKRGDGQAVRSSAALKTQRDVRLPSFLDDGADQVEKHHARDRGAESGARAGAPLSTSKPDLVFRRWRTVLFVNGCFWHSHRNCERARMPKTNRKYWTKKLLRNARRDQENVELLKKSGWRCAIIWECQAKDLANLNRILRRLFASDRSR
jgi:DNA mismatch endonuclease Vsr